MPTRRASLPDSRAVFLALPEPFPQPSQGIWAPSRRGIEPGRLVATWCGGVVYVLVMSKVDYVIDGPARKNSGAHGQRRWPINPVFQNQDIQSREEIRVLQRKLDCRNCAFGSVTGTVSLGFLACNIKDPERR